MSDLISFEYIFLEELVSGKKTVDGNFTIRISRPDATFQKRGLRFEVILKGKL